MTECEGTNNCATWTFLGTQGNGQWPSGEVANLNVEKLDADTVVIRRADSTGASAGLTAVYQGTRHGDRIGGEFTSSWPGHWNNMSGNWYATIGKAAQSLPSVICLVQGTFASVGEVAGLPCATLTWNGGHYDAVFTGVQCCGGVVTATMTVVSFSPESVILNRVDYGSHAGTYVYTGKISSQGDSILNGDVSGMGSVGHFTATWGAALGNHPAAQPRPQVVVRPGVCFQWFFSVVCE
jgi:hypothetical protein